MLAFLMPLAFVLILLFEIGGEEHEQSAPGQWKTVAAAIGSATNTPASLRRSGRGTAVPWGCRRRGMIWNTRSGDSWARLRAGSSFSRSYRRKRLEGAWSLRFHLAQ
jgi:hypothetical protein